MRLTNKKKLEIADRKNEKLIKMVEAERERVAGYEQIAKLHAAYIAHLLGKLGATKDNPLTITKDDVAEAMKLEVRGAPCSEGFKLYIEE